MPKMLIIDHTIVNFGDDRGGQGAEAGDLVDVPREQAAALVTWKRAMYTRKQDDPSKGGLDTAPENIVAAAEQAQKARAEGKTRADLDAALAQLPGDQADADYVVKSMRSFYGSLFTAKDEAAVRAAVKPKA
ncbi:hypothetical protein [Hydrocarboniphaga sp.]|uniref:hypothetical protein n=1 Tax=Hydrocarboniphaga sp. TaxID=2033016 RepID=UPI003D13DF84